MKYSYYFPASKQEKRKSGAKKGRKNKRKGRRREERRKGNESSGDIDKGMKTKGGRAFSNYVFCWKIEGSP